MWPVTGTETKYENNWMSVREDAVVRPDGSPGSFGVMTVRHASVFVVALTEDDQVWLVDVDRHTVLDKQTVRYAAVVHRYELV